MEDLVQWERRASLERRDLLDMQVRMEIRDLWGCPGLQALQDPQETMEIRESRADRDRRAVKETKEKLDPLVQLDPKGLLGSLDFQEWMGSLVRGGNRACMVQREMKVCGVSRVPGDQLDYRECQDCPEKRVRVDMWG